MELDELKNIWRHKAADKEPLLNNKMIKKMIRKKSASGISRIRNYEYLNITVCLVVLGVFLVQWNNMVIQKEVFICYLFTMLVILISLALGIYKLRRLNGIDPGNQPVVQAGENLERFRLFMWRERLASMLLMPVLLFTLIVVVHFWIRQENILDRLPASGARIILAIVLGIAATLFVYRELYFKTIRMLKKIIHEYAAFRNESGENQS